VAARSHRLILIIALIATVSFAILWRISRDNAPSLAEIFPYGEIRIGVDASNPPFAVATADDLFGLEIDLGNALAGQIGIPVRFVNMTYDGLYDALKIDQVDALIATLTIEPLRTADVLYTRHYFNAGLVLVSPLSQPLETASDLSNHALAYEFGSDADALARRWLRRIAPFETQPYELPAHALDAVRLGQADAALVDATSARLHLSEHKWEAQLSYVTDHWHPVAVRSDQVARWQMIDKALQVLDDNGTLDEIINRWL
jgi:polar amino acid transport system substrate-binding protein